MPAQNQQLTSATCLNWSGKNDSALGSNKLSESIPVREPHSLPRPILVFPHECQTSADQVPWILLQFLAIQTDDVVRGILNRLEQNLSRDEFQRLLCLFRLLSKSQDGVANLRIEFSLQLWQQAVSNSVASVVLVSVRTVLPKVLVDVCQI